MTSTIRTVTTNMIFEVKDKTGRPMMTTHDPRCVYDDDTCKEMRAAAARLLNATTGETGSTDVDTDADADADDADGDEDEGCGE